jgi:hypothetical protein
MKRARTREPHHDQMPQVPSRPENQPGTQRLKRGVRDLLATLTHGVKAEVTTKTRRPPGRGGHRDRHSRGIDVGDKERQSDFLDVDGAMVTEGRLATTRDAFVADVSAIPQARMAIEVGTHSAWGSEGLAPYGHDVVPAHPRRMESISKKRRKHDNVDARPRARLGRVAPAR